MRIVRINPQHLSSAGPARPRPACADEDPTLFFPVGNSAAALEQIAEAKEVCRGCPMATDCLQTALEHDEAGVWGGTCEQERDLMKRRAARKAQAAA
ncbi:WhiB family transcriptional regulator [Streptomyces sp. NRRL F-5053]|uniref:WhiB family transcriptional regulator n=1 Tax=Streptomyces sp. NRRL F-5053 TaxID=1463854 RepID=UPI0004CB91F5